jgi:uncharacterized membrane protein YphA (DoxX/SURF4 family)
MALARRLDCRAVSHLGVSIPGVFVRRRTRGPKRRGAHGGKQHHRELEVLGSVPAEPPPDRRGDPVHPVRDHEALRLSGRDPPNNATAEWLTQTWFGGVLEVFGGFLILIGLFTRPVAFILAGEMAVAYFQFHLPQSFWTVVNMGTPAVLYCFLWLFFSAAGAGRWSVDAKRGK